MSALVLAALFFAAPAEKGGVDALLKANLERSAPAIDACVARYVYEKPGARGKARITARFEKNGTVGTARVETALEEPRNLSVCLRRVARGWTLPQLADEGEVAVTVGVHEGAKFRLVSEEEKAKAEAEAERRRAAAEAEAKKKLPLEDFTFTPGGFWNGAWGTSGDLPGEAPEGGSGRGQPAPSDEGAASPSDEGAASPSDEGAASPSDEGAASSGE